MSNTILLKQGLIKKIEPSLVLTAIFLALMRSGGQGGKNPADETGRRFDTESIENPSSRNRGNRNLKKCGKLLFRDDVKAGSSPVTDMKRMLISKDSVPVQTARITGNENHGTFRNSEGAVFLLEKKQRKYEKSLTLYK